MCPLMYAHTLVVDCSLLISAFLIGLCVKSPKTFRDSRNEIILLTIDLWLFSTSFVYKDPFGVLINKNVRGFVSYDDYYNQSSRGPVYLLLFYQYNHCLSNECPQ